MKIIDFENTTPDFINGNFKWFSDEYFNRYIQIEQADNLPALSNIACFIVKSDTVQDYVLINNNQEILAGYSYPHGFEQIETKINILKISKYFDDYEKNDLQ